MKIAGNIHRLKIEFDVTPEIRRFVYIYLIEGRHLYLIDTGVDGTEKMIASYLKIIGRSIGEIRAVLLTHSHPDHIGAAYRICTASGCKVYASAGERNWIEDIDEQFANRPIPNFYKFVNNNTEVTDIIRGGDILHLEDGITMRAVNAGGHSQESLAYHFLEEQVLFTGDAVPAAGDVPIYVNADDSIETLKRLDNITDIRMYLPAWDEPADTEEGHLAIKKHSNSSITLMKLPAARCLISRHSILKNSSRLYAESLEWNIKRTTRCSKQLFFPVS